MVITATSAGGTATATINLSQDPSAFSQDVPFSSFTTTGTFNFAAVTSLTVTFNPPTTTNPNGVPAVDLQLDKISAVEPLDSGYNFANHPNTPLAITTTQQPATTTVGNTIADIATVTGGDNPTGTVTFSLYNNATASGTPLFTSTQTLSSGTATSASYTTVSAGTDYWVATYNGDENNDAITSTASAEPVVINTPLAISTTQQPATTTVGNTIADTATVTGGINPTGTVTFALYNNATASGTPLFTDTETLSGGTATSASYTTVSTGTVYWVATYNGDDNNDAITSTAGAEPVVINPVVTTASLSGYKYVDANNTGVKVAGEPGIAGVIITLTGTTTTGGSVSQMTTTASDGSYSFTNLNPGTYTLTETLPSNFVPGQPTAGSLGGTTSGYNVIGNITVTAGANGTNYNFGELGLTPQYVSKRMYLTPPEPVNLTAIYPPGTPGTNLGNAAVPMITVVSVEASHGSSAIPSSHSTTPAVTTSVVTTLSTTTHATTTAAAISTAVTPAIATTPTVSTNIKAATIATALTTPATAVTTTKTVTPAPSSSSVSHATAPVTPAKPTTTTSALSSLRSLLTRNRG